MAVDVVVTGVDHAIREPAAVRSHRGIEDLPWDFDPVDLARRLGPKTLGVAERAGVDFVIPAFLADVHGALPVARLLVMPGLVPASTSFAPDQRSKSWMAGTSPALTAGGEKALHPMSRGKAPDQARTA